MGFTTIDEGAISPPGWTYRPNLVLLVPGVLLATGALLWFLILSGLEAANGTGCQTARCGGKVSPLLGVPVAILILAACVAFISSLFIYVRVSGGVLSAQRLWWKKFEIPVSSVKSVEPGYYGLTITNEDGRVFRSLTPQQPNVNAVRKMRGISGEVAGRILAARDAARNGTSSS
ncbi:MAG: hypothetical protein KGJ39_03830 [Acidobacteriota bacterium]|nr:hypothetical protein [Acidobacteriota bacterium]